MTGRRIMEEMAQESPFPDPPDEGRPCREAGAHLLHAGMMIDRRPPPPSR
jgi:hypothetical protein